jgi:hypothetical protein
VPTMSSDHLAAYQAFVWLFLVEGIGSGRSQREVSAAHRIAAGLVDNAQPTLREAGTPISNQRGVRDPDLIGQDICRVCHSWMKYLFYLHIELREECLSCPA